MKAYLPLTILSLGAVSVLILRLLFIPHAFPPATFYEDAFFDDCFSTYNWVHHEYIWQGGTNTLAYAAYNLSYRLFGFSQYAASRLCAASFSLAVFFFCLGTKRMFGLRAASILLGTLALSYPFILHSIYSTIIPLSFLPVAIVFTIVAYGRSSVAFSILTAALAVAALYLYPAAPIAILSLLTANVIIARSGFKLLAATFLAVLVSSGLRTQFGGGHFVSLEQLPDIWINLKVIVSDLFVFSESWDSLNGTRPYFEPVLSPFLICAVPRLFTKGLSKSEKTFVATCFLAFLLSVLGASLIIPYPGVRRALPALPFLYAGVIGAFSRTTFGPMLAALIVIATGSLSVSRVAWPMWSYTAFNTAQESRLEEAATGKSKLIIYTNTTDSIQHEALKCTVGLRTGKQVAILGTAPAEVPFAAAMLVGGAAPVYKDMKAEQMTTLKVRGEVSFFLYSPESLK